MTDDDFETSILADKPLFSALITPHRSLGTTGFMVLMGGIVLVSFATGMMFLQMGAWPVLVFFTLDAALIYAAFRLNYRAAHAFEEVIVTPTQLRVRRINHRGYRAQWMLNPLWVRLDRHDIEEFGTDELYLVSGGKRLAIAGFLGARDKADFADALTLALQAAKRGPLSPSH